MTPAQQRGAETTARVIEAALACFEEAGLTGFTVQRLSERCGVSIGSLYHHFGSLNGIAASVYAEAMSRLLDAIVEALPPGTPAREGIEAVVRTYLRWSRDNTAAARFIHASAFADFVPEHAERIVKVKSSRLETLLGWLGSRVTAGEIVALPSWQYEMLVIGPVAETVRRWLRGDPKIDLEEAQRFLPERVWCSVRATQAQSGPA